LNNVVNKVKEFLLKLYLLPANSSTRMAMSVRNRIFPEYLHLRGLVLAIHNFRSKGDFGNTILDIGCFEGNTALFFLKELKDVNVIGIEASSQSYKQAVTATEKYDAIKIENYALSDFCGKTEFYVTDNKVSSSLKPVTGTDTRFSTVQVEQVNTITLDEYFLSHTESELKILAMKLDVQGHELNVLKGAEKTMKRTLFVLTELSNHETYKGGARYYEVDQLLREYGFVLQNIFSGYNYEKHLYEYDAIYVNGALL